MCVIGWNLLEAASAAARDIWWLDDDRLDHTSNYNLSLDYDNAVHYNRCAYDNVYYDECDYDDEHHHYE